MPQSIFIDFYGTVGYEDGAVIERITEEIYKTGTAQNRFEIGAFWWNQFQSLFQSAYGDQFETQRELEYQSLVRTLEKFHSPLDAQLLSEQMFAHWVQPPIFEEAKHFFETCPLPLYIVSNIDRNDILQAVHYHGLTPVGIITSEDARAYKPRKEMFEYALKSARVSETEVIHIGDSLSSDVNGAGACGIHSVWINRSGREVPHGVRSVGSLRDVFMIIQNY